MSQRVKAKFTSVKISPRKLDRVARLLRGKKVSAAIDLLQFMPQKGAKILADLIKSAKANAENNYKLDAAKLLIDEVFVNQGFIMRRWRAQARGRAGKITKKTTHVTVWIKEAA